MAREWREVKHTRTSKTRRLFEDGQPTNKYSSDVDLTVAASLDDDWSSVGSHVPAGDYFTIT
ncbi:unnamed protein product, partial [marine sediment metagenome]